MLSSEGWGRRVFGSLGAPLGNHHLPRVNVDAHRLIGCAPASHDRFKRAKELLATTSARDDNRSTLLLNRTEDFYAGCGDFACDGGRPIGRHVDARQRSERRITEFPSARGLRSIQRIGIPAGERRDGRM
jgi:hypothetical protein